MQGDAATEAALVREQQTLVRDREHSVPPTAGRPAVAPWLADEYGPAFRQCNNVYKRSLG